MQILKICDTRTIRLYNCKKIRVLKVLCDTLPANKFDNLSSLQKVVLGGDLKHIENGVFTGCESLDSLVCYSEHIKNWGIYVDNLTDFTIGNSVKTIGEDVFKAMYSLENITIESSVPPIVDENAFAKFQFSSVKLSVPEESIEVYKSEEVWGKFYTINGWVPANISILKSNDNKPIVVYTILLAFTAPWGDYMFASVIAAGDSSLFNVAVGLQQLLTKAQEQNQVREKS